LIICEVLARRSDHQRALQLLDLLFELHLWRGGRDLDNRIIDGLSHLALMTGLSYPRLSPRIAELLWEMSFHFVGPEDVEMDRSDEGYVVKCVDALETLGRFNCAFGHGHKAADAVTETAEQFMDVAVWYRRPKIARAVVRCYREALKACYDDDDWKIAFAYGRARMIASIQRAVKALTAAGGFIEEERRLSILLKWKPKVKTKTPDKAVQ